MVSAVNIIERRSLAVHQQASAVFERTGRTGGTTSSLTFLVCHGYGTTSEKALPWSEEWGRLY